jgi:hypothetical protein
MRVVYIAGKFRGRDSWVIENNIRRAEELSLQVDTLGGVIALCPHTNTRFFQGALPDDFWLEGTLELMRRCDAVLMVPGWEESVGARGEKAEAERRGMPVFTSLADLDWWLRNVPEAA